MGLKNRVLNALLGAAIGDALGVPYEFVERDYFYLQPVTGMDAYGTHNQPAGTWSDDTAMTWATVDVLVKHVQKEPSQNFLKALVEAFLAWLHTGKYTARGEVFDVGNTTHGALMDYAITPNFEDRPLVLEGASDVFSQGNGSLMRFLPVALWHAVEPWPDELLTKCSQITHAHPVAVDACLHYANTVRFSLKHDFETASQLASHRAKKQGASYVPDMQNIWHRPEYEVKSSGYVVDTLEAAYWCVYHGGNYRDCVLRAVNLGGDTDTVASITGGLCAWLQSGAIPTVWLDALAQKKALMASYCAYGEKLSHE